MKTLKNKKGFTLIEIIVVLVILAILAAATIPSMLKFVDDANGKALVAEARTAYLAAQMLATEQKATEATYVAPTQAEVLPYLDLKEGETVTIGIVDTDSDGKIDSVSYQKGDTKVVITAGGTAEVSKVS